MSARVRLTSSSDFHGLLGQHLDCADVLLLCRPDLFVFVGVNQRADAFVGEHFGEQAFILAAADDVDALHARSARGSRVLRLGKHFRLKAGTAGLHQSLQIRHQHLPNEFTVISQAIVRGDVNQLSSPSAHPPAQVRCCRN